MLRMAKTVYDGTLPKDGWDMRDLLAAYCASRMGSNENHDFNDRSTCWEPTDVRLLAESQLEEFIGDVMCKIRPGSKFNSGEFIMLHFMMASSTSS